MNTPICDFVNRYAESGVVRLHMPGHKGASILGFEKYDITEIEGADSLYEARGIIAESEKNASELFGCYTYYSTEGSSLAIRAMLCLAARLAAKEGRECFIAAGRNAHKVFMSSAALLDIKVEWIRGNSESSFLSCAVTAQDIEMLFKEKANISAVYLTSPDYLGSMTDLKEIADVCHKNGALLLVDNAHGAYRFLRTSRFPIDLGADICASSAHKTLPALTGAAYLHISKNSSPFLSENAKEAMLLFGSTSPSYLILQSLDALNKYLCAGYRERLEAFIKMANDLKRELIDMGYTLCGNEPLKITVMTKKYGYKGCEMAKTLEERGIVSEFSDPDFLVLMLAPENGKEGLCCLKKAMENIPKRAEICEKAPRPSEKVSVMSIREAMIAPSVTVSAKDAEGRILASASASCPPAVPIAVCGERIDASAVNCFRYYGIDNVRVVEEDSADKL
ncbi:MAG: aminotransferase class V-fold PLP-dependent enzyme [Clostridia bacterium]|nr:aminotransferase class V-fold PLP-dependent enzyme [Clostridia bacterium]